MSSEIFLEIDHKIYGETVSTSGNSGLSSHDQTVLMARRAFSRVSCFPWSSALASVQTLSRNLNMHKWISKLVLTSAIKLRVVAPRSPETPMRSSKTSTTAGSVAEESHRHRGDKPNAYVLFRGQWAR